MLHLRLFGDDEEDEEEESILNLEDCFPPTVSYPILSRYFY